MLYLILVCVLAGAATACNDDGEPVGGTPTTSAVRTGGPGVPTPVVWTDCGDGFQCGSIPAPLDYDRPRRATIDVALIRRPASDPDARIGSLLVNPGGPGASGVEFVRLAADLFPEELQSRFDIVGFDPRGSGATMPIDCDFDLDAVFALDATPDTIAERTALERTNADLADACAASNGRDLPFVTTQDTVRDMDRIRAAVGDEALTYLGYSYGTYLGALYADRYPTHVRAMLLDGAVDPTLPAVESTLTQAAGFEQSLEAFFADCASDSGCEFSSDGDPAAAFDDLVADIDATGVPADDGRTLGPGETDVAVASALYLGETGYDELASALAAAADGDGDPLLALSDSYTGRNDDGSYNGRQEAFWAIGCADGGATVTNDAEQRDLERRAEAVSPHFGIASVNLAMVCRYWPVPGEAPLEPVHADGAPPIVVIGTTGDPATPLAWAESLADQLQRGELVVVEGSQHGAFALRTDECIDDIGVRYLVDLEVPPAGTMCG